MRGDVPTRAQGDVSGGDNQPRRAHEHDGEIFQIRIFAQLLAKLEAVHLRHDEVDEGELITRAVRLGRQAYQARTKLLNSE